MSASAKGPVSVLYNTMSVKAIKFHEEAPSPHHPNKEAGLHTLSARTSGNDMPQITPYTCELQLIKTMPQKCGHCFS